jgi:hypothetical protein
VLTSLIVFISTLFFWYWAKRVFCLIYRPDEIGPMLKADLFWAQDFWTTLRSMFFPPAANYS